MSEAPEPQEPGFHPQALAAVERTASRAIFFLALAVLVGTMFLTENRKTPAPALLAICGVFVVAKLAVLVVGLRHRWNQAPAVGLQAVAFALIGWVVAAEITSAAPLLVIAALLIGAAMWRQRLAQRDDA